MFILLTGIAVLPASGSLGAPLPGLIVGAMLTVMALSIAGFWAGAVTSQTVWDICVASVFAALHAFGSVGGPLGGLIFVAAVSPTQ